MLHNLRLYLLLCSLITGLFVASQTAQAHRRSYVWTQEYHTQAQGEAELEYFLTTKIADLHKFDDKNTWQHQVELEYGLTDHFQLAVYQTAQHTHDSKRDGDFDYTGSKLEAKYRIAEKGQLPVDTTLYMEYVQGEGPSNTDKMEYKLILSKDIDRFNFTYNQIIEHAVAETNKTAYEYAAGVFYEVNPTWHLGAESAGNYTTDSYRVGPTISYATEKFWLTVGVARGLTERGDDFRGRLILGIPF
jgi:hypothetical protein